MSIQWVAVAGFLYVEIALTLLLILPLLKPSAWKWIFSMKFFSAIQPMWTTIYYSLLLVLIVLFVDSIRRMVKYGNDLSGATLDAKLDRRLNECRGQRNFYITGFALFLILVIKRLISMLSTLASLEASHAAVVRQAQAANAELARRINEADEGTKKKGSKDTEKEGVEDVPKDTEEKTPGPSKEEYADLQNELRKARSDLEAIKKQAESTSAEYDRLAEEHQQLLKTVGDGDESKKDQ